MILKRHNVRVNTDSIFSYYPIDKTEGDVSYYYIYFLSSNNNQYVYFGFDSDKDERDIFLEKLDILLNVNDLEKLEEYDITM